MSFGKPVKLLKAEAIITCIILASAMLFSLEPTREFLMQSLIEQQYHELESFKNISNMLSYKRLRAKDLNYIAKTLDSIDNARENFILKEDLEILKARTYERLGNSGKSKEILLSLLNINNDPLSRMDAMLALANIFDRENSPGRAIKILETYKNINLSYKKQEILFLLARLYYQTGQLKKSGKAMIYAGGLDSEERPFYSKIILLNWPNYSQEEKKTVLTSLSRMGIYEAYASCAGSYIREYLPPFDETEALSLDIVFNSGAYYVKDFLSKIKNIPGYTPIYDELTDVYTLSRNTIRSQSGIVRGYYYYRRLRPLVRRARYNDRKAVEYFKNYLNGNVDYEYVKKNLQLTIRNLLAYKKYEEITNAIEKKLHSSQYRHEYRSYQRRYLFLAGYSSYMLGDKNKALKYFESTVSKIPDGYFSIQAKSYINSILDETKQSEDLYTGRIEGDYKYTQDLGKKLYYGRLLFAFKKGGEREKLKKEVAALTEKFNNNVFFDFEDRTLDKLKNNVNYVKFIAHIRFGLLDKAKAILTSEDVSDPTVQDILILRELVKNKDFEKAGQIYDSLAKSDFINENFAFMSHDLQTLLYPTPYDGEINFSLDRLETNHLDPYMVYAIIRGESMYIPQACSYAGARGLMQIMPGTARLIAENILGKRNVNLYNTVNNIMLGTAFLNSEIDSYGLLPAIASYNGGIRIINFTREKFSPENEIELMELVPYTETREYVKKILSNYYRYKNLYDHGGSWNVKLPVAQKKQV